MFPSFRIRTCKLQIDDQVAARSSCPQVALFAWFQRCWSSGYRPAATSLVKAETRALTLPSRRDSQRSGVLRRPAAVLADAMLRAPRSNADPAGSGSDCHEIDGRSAVGLMDCPDPISTMPRRRRASNFTQLCLVRSTFFRRQMAP